ncbi:MAG TPA: cytochrome c oxidase assembly protein [Dehalococcoidia bacterium]|jgi:putative membrane protein|nr:cytochrome c oxidase assembly protein [Dehalococcoidia bacterium]
MPLHVIVGQSWYAWHTHPDVIVLCLGFLVSYWYAITVWRPHIPDAGRVKQSQVFYYCSGVAVIYIATGSPMHDIAENYLLGVHMTQHLLLSLVAPPLLLAGVPTWLWEALFVRRYVYPVIRIVLNPLLAIFCFNMFLVMSHLPEVLNFTLEHHWFHFFMHVILMTTAVMMWWPVITNVPKLPHLTYPYQMAYMFVQSLIPAVVGSFITFSSSPVYSFYARAPRIWGLSPVEDQQWGALVMKLIGSLILWAFIGVAFFKWYAREEAEDKGIRWADVEEELREIGVTPRS